MSGEYPVLWSEGTKGDLWVGNLTLAPTSIRLDGGNGSETTNKQLTRDTLAAIRYSDDDEQLVRTKTLRLELKTGSTLLITTLAGAEVLGQVFNGLLGLLGGG